MQTPKSGEPAEHSALTSAPAIVAYIALAKLLLNIYAARNYGYFVDELYYLACSDHLDWGYVDQPPLIAVITKLARLLLGDSLVALRFFPALAGTAKIWLAGWIARELGGGRFAQALAALAVLVAPIYLSLDHLLTMNAFEPLFWMGCILVVIRIIQTGNQKLWLWFGLLAGVGLQNKHSMLFFGFGVFVGLLATEHRRLFLQRWIWIAGVLAVLIFLPNLIWEIHHGFPTIELLRNVRNSGRNVSLSSLEFILQQILLMHPLTFPIWLAGLWYYLASQKGKSYRLLGWAYVVLLVTFLVAHGRVYYLAPIYPMLLAAGAIVFENALSQPRRSWLKPAFIALLIVGGAIFTPFALPVLPVETYIRYSRALHFEPPKIETHRTGKLPQLYADMFGWEEMAATVARVYHNLPPEERARTAIFGNNYGQAGAIDFFGPKYGLPKAISAHQNYYYWGPRDFTTESIIVLGDTREVLEKQCPSLTEVAVVHHEYSMPYENFSLFLCRGPKTPIAKIWPRLKKWN